MTPDPTALRAAAEAATKGPWYVHENDLVGGWMVRRLDQPPSQDTYEERRDNAPVDVADFMERKDAEFLALCTPETILALLDAAQVALWELDEVRNTCRDGALPGEPGPILSALTMTIDRLATAFSLPDPGRPAAHALDSNPGTTQRRESAALAPSPPTREAALAKARAILERWPLWEDRVRAIADALAPGAEGEKA